MPEDENLSGEFIIGEKKPKEKPAQKNTKIISAAPDIPSDKHSIHFYSSLGINPENVSFENQEEDEEIVLLVRRDLITNVPWIAAAIALAIIPPLIFIFQDLFTPFFQISGITQLIAIIFYYLIVAGFVLVEFTLWYFNIGIVTNKRIIDLDVSGVLFKHVSETKLNLIEDVSYSQIGAIRSVFNYGDVTMQTAGTLSNFEFDRAPEPARIVRIIAEMIGKKQLK